MTSKTYTIDDPNAFGPGQGISGTFKLTYDGPDNAPTGIKSLDSADITANGQHFTTDNGGSAAVNTDTNTVYLDLSSTVYLDPSSPPYSLRVAYVGEDPTTLLTGTPGAGDQVTIFTDAQGNQVYATSGGSISCFCAGTEIATPSGSRAIETLAIGDLVLTAEGTAEPVRWIGRQTVMPRFVDRLTTLPIRIRANAIADGIPARDLLVSPSHAVAIDGILVEAHALVNGTSITQSEIMPESFVYYHIELKNHALILAEGLAAETFVDNVDRVSFDNWAEHQALFGDLDEMCELEMPRAQSRRQLPKAIRERIDGRVAALEIAA